jgi:thioredoxin-related protein
LRKSILTLLFLIISLQLTLDARDIDINAIVSDAKKTDKHVLVFLHKTDCGYCDSMIIFTLDDDAVKEMIKKYFVFIDINISDNDKVTYKSFKGSGHDFAKHVGYNFYPSSLFIDENDEIVFAAPGRQDENDFYIMLNYVNSKSYKTMDLQSFENTKDFEKEF